MTYFSEAFLALAAPHAAWAVERNDRFRRFLDGKWLKTEIPHGRVRLDDAAVPAGLLASYAEDFTLKWGWSFGRAPGDPEAPWMPSPRGLCAAVLTVASMVQPLVPRGHRYRVMRAMVHGFFARAGMACDGVGEPEVFIGRRGVVEYVVELAHDCTLNDVRVGRPFEWLARASADGRI